MSTRTVPKQKMIKLIVSSTKIGSAPAKVTFRTLDGRIVDFKDKKKERAFLKKAFPSNF